MIDYSFFGEALIYGLGLSLLTTVPIFMACTVFRILKSAVF